MMCVTGDLLDRVIDSYKNLSYYQDAEVGNILCTRAIVTIGVIIHP